MEELREQLEAKQQELDDLQATFDEFVESSKELESELEGTLNEMEEKRRETIKQIRTLDNKVAELNLKNESLINENNKLQAMLNKKTEALNEKSERVKVLELSNSDYENKIRELEFTESELLAKIELIEEEKIILQYNAEASSPNKPSNETKRLKAELTELQAELAKVDNELLEFKAREKEINAKEKELVRSQQILARQQQTEETLQIHSHLNSLEAKLRQVTQEKAELQAQLRTLSPDSKGSKQKIPRSNSLPVTPVGGGGAGGGGGSMAKKPKDFDDEANESLIDELTQKLAESEENNKDLNQLLEDTQEELMTKCQENADCLREISELQNALKDQEAIAAKISAENEELARQLTELSKEVATSSDDLGDGPGGQVSAIHSQLNVITQEYKNATKNWVVEKSALLREKEKLQREIIGLRKHRLSDTMDDMELSVNESFGAESLNESGIVFKLIDSTGRARLAAEQAIASNDIRRMKEELKHQLTRFEHMRTNNAILLNKLQSAKGNIQVCCRTRPPNDMELGQGSKICIDVVDETELACYDKRTHTWRSFNFDRVWDEDATQADVFADIEPLALSVVDGYNASIIAYGQTGSGKTFTMNGYGTDYGVSYRTLHKIFELLNLKKSQAEHHAEKISLNRTRTKHGRLMSGAVDNEISDSEGGVGFIASSQASLSSIEGDDVPSDLSDHEESHPATEHKSNGLKKKPPTKTGKKMNGRGDDLENNSNSFVYSVEVAMLEIYNETVKDLLIPPNSAPPTVALEIRHDSDGRVSVPGLMRESVTCLEDVMEVFARGSANRATTSTNLNEHSSRSHSILIVHVTTSSDNGVPITGKLYLVDLAGSERMDKSGVTGQAMKETQHINKSLSSLGDVMEGLDKKSKHIPYRNSKLTYLLQDSLGGNSKTMMIVTVCPTELTADESLFALQFATRARNIQLGPAKKNMSWKTLEESLKAVKQELKAEKRRSQHFNEVITDMKRESKKSQEKLSTQMDTKLRNIDETRKGAELQIEVMSRTNADLMAKLQEEKEARRLATAECDTIQKSLRKAQENLKMLNRDKEKTLNTLETRNKEIENLRQLLRNIPGTGASSKQHRGGNSSANTSTMSNSANEKSLASSSGPSEKPTKTSSSLSNPSAKSTTNPAVKPSKFLASSSATAARTTASHRSTLPGKAEGNRRPRTQSEASSRKSSETSAREEEKTPRRETSARKLDSRLSRSSSTGRIREDDEEMPRTPPMRQRSNSEDFLERESVGRDKSSRLSSSDFGSKSQRNSTPKSTADDEAETPNSPPVVLAGSYRKGTMNAMATSRAQDAMIRHQERMKKKREMDAANASAKANESEWK